MSLIDPVHLHLMLNHVPVLGSVFALLLLATGLLFRREHLQKIGLAVIAIVAIVALPVYLTGEPTEEAVEHLSGVVETTINAHQDAATIAFASVLATGVIGLGGLFLSRRGRVLSRPVVLIALLACLTTVVLMGRTANLGGKIRHSEISSGAVSNVQPEKHNHDEDD